MERPTRSTLVIFGISPVLVVLGVSCASTVRISEVTNEKAVAVRLDANARAHEPGRQIKFFVDLLNETGRTIDVTDLHIELRVLDPTDSKILLRNDWTYRWPQTILIADGRKLSVPILPERGVELPIEHLPAGSYDIVAVVNDRFLSPPYRLKNLRPDLRPPLRRT